MQDFGEPQSPLLFEKKISEKDTYSDEQLEKFTLEKSCAGAPDWPREHRVNINPWPPLQGGFMRSSSASAAPTTGLSGVNSESDTEASLQ